MTDKTTILNLLQDALAEQLLARVRSGEATASDLNVARQFLKDNGIDADPTKNKPLRFLAQELPDLPPDSAVN